MSEPSLRVIVCGGRRYRNGPLVWQTLDGLLNARGKFVLLQGGAAGANRLVKLWAKYRGVPDVEFKADWAQYGMAAGPIRNQQMLDSGASLVVAFAGGRGTADMVWQARRRNVEVIEVEESEASRK